MGKKKPRRGSQGFVRWTIGVRDNLVDRPVRSTGRQRWGSKGRVEKCDRLSQAELTEDPRRWGAGGVPLPWMTRNH